MQDFGNGFWRGRGTWARNSIVEESAMLQKYFQFSAVISIMSLSFSIIAPGLVYAQLNAPALQTQDTGYLLLQSDHKGLVVKIDGELIGYTPVEVISLSAGAHEIHVSHPNRANWLDRDWLKEIDIIAGDTLRVKVAFERSYSIHSQPFGAAVFLADRKIGETPLFFNLNEGEIKEVTLTKEGFRDTTFSVGLTDEQFFDIALKPVTQSVAVPLDKKNKQSNSKLYLYSAIGLSVVSGVTALYFRSRANDKYESYLQTGNPARFNAFYDDARKFDRYAAISFGTFQISFIVSFYLFLKEANR